MQATDLLKAAMAAQEAGNEAEAAAHFMAFAKTLGEETEAKFEELQAENQKLRKDLSVAGVQLGGKRLLSTEECEFYDKLTKLDYKNALTGAEITVPQTIMERVFEDINLKSSLLAAVDLQNTTGLTDIIFATGAPLEVKITSITGAPQDAGQASLTKITLPALLISCVFTVSNGHLALGAPWLDEYIRTLLAEAMILGLEKAIVDGDGKDNFIGMTRNVSPNVSVSAGVYPKKTAVKVTDFAPTTFGGLLSKLATGAGGRSREIGELVLICNTEDYYKKVMPATMVQNTAGQYVGDVFSHPTKVIHRQFVPANTAVIGIGKRYFCGIGAGNAKQPTITHDDSVKFMTNERAYRSLLYGNGRAYDDESFILLDITGLKPMTIKVETLTTPAAP